MKTLGVDGPTEHTTTRLKGVLPNPNLIRVLSYRHTLSVLPFQLRPPSLKSSMQRKKN